MRRYDHGGDIYGNAHVALDFSVNTHPLGMPEGAKHALAACASDYERYPDPRCRALTAALGIYHSIAEDMILCGNGAADLIFRICACLKPQNALSLAPTFSEYERSVSLFGGRMREYSLTEQNGFTVTDGILDLLSPELDILFLCNPNNPTGRLTDTALLCRIADQCEQNSIHLVLDECFIEFTDGESMILLLESHPYMMILRAFTKLYAMAGLRLGYLLSANTALLAEVSRFAQTWSVSVPAQTAGLAALKERGWAESTQRLVREERAYMAQTLTALGLEVLPGDANFLLIKSEIPLCKPLLERGILARDCSNFSGLNERYIRIGLKSRDKNNVLLNAISEVLHG